MMPYNLYNKEGKEAMGKIKKIECPQCKKYWEIKVGAGKNHCNMKYILPHFTMKKQEEIKK